MHLQESTLFDFDLGVKATQMLLSILYIMWPIHLHGLILLHLTVKEEMHLQEITLFDLDLGSRSHKRFNQYPLHHVTYPGTKFEVAVSNGQGDAFTRNYII